MEYYSKSLLIDIALNIDMIFIDKVFNKINSLIYKCPITKIGKIILTEKTIFN